ncbi:hypothetical protein RUND412_000209 [Rhizina undulata]
MAALNSLKDLTKSVISLIDHDLNQPNSSIKPCGPGFYELLHTLIQTFKSTGNLDSADASILHSIAKRCDDLLRLCNDKFYSYPYKDVPAYWRRAYTDAALLKAACGIGELISEARTGDGEIVRCLDMVLIMAGAPGREELVGGLLEALGEHEKELAGEEIATGNKRWKVRFEQDLIPDGGPDPDIKFPISRREHSEFEETFDSHLYRPGGPTPVIITGSLSHWPAMDSRPWSSTAYLLSKTNSGKRLVPVEVGKSYTDEDWGQKLMTFREFLKKYILEASETKGYLAQHDLLSQVPSLRNDIAIPDYCWTSPPPPPENVKKVEVLAEPLINAWFGPKGTVSPLHTDPYHNILCQVVGRKYVRLYPPDETEKVYPRGVQEDGLDMSNTSYVDVEGDDEEIRRRFPRFRQARYVEGVLNQGGALFIPCGWWHYVRSLDVSFSVSFWWN